MLRQPPNKWLSQSEVLCLTLFFSVFSQCCWCDSSVPSMPPLRLAWKNKLHNLCLIEYLTVAFSHFGFHCLICFYEACHIVYDASLLNSGFTLKHFFMELTKLSGLCLCHLYVNWGAEVVFNRETPSTSKVHSRQYTLYKTLQRNKEEREMLVLRWCSNVSLSATPPIFFYLIWMRLALSPKGSGQWWPCLKGRVWNRCENLDVILLVACNFINYKSISIYSPTVG